MNKSYIIPSLRFDFFFIIVICAIFLPIIGFSFWTILELPGILFLFLFWLPFIWIMFKYFSSKKERVEISETGITIYQYKKIVPINWSEIEKIGFLAIISKRMGIYEAYPHLSIKLISSSRSKIESIVSYNEYGFFKKTEDLANYMSKEEKYDLFVNSRFLVDNDKVILDYLSSKPMFVKSISPLIKTGSQEEYDKVTSENFKTD